MQIDREDQDRKSLLAGLDTRTKVLGLICLIAEALLLAALVKLQGAQVIYALISCALILISTIFVIMRIELKGSGVEFKGSGIAPLRAKFKYDAYVAMPMAAAETEEDYQRFRREALEVVQALKEGCHRDTVYCSLEDISSKKEFDDVNISLKDDIEKVRECSLVSYST